MMKKVVVAAVIAMSALSANAGSLKLCAIKANEICEELKGKDFIECHRTQMGFCIDDLYNNKSWTPYGQTCEERCLELPDVHYPLCIQECFLTI